MPKKPKILTDISVDGDMSKEKCELLLRYKSENVRLEWKGFGIPHDSNAKCTLAKSIIAMSNTEGGWILLGKDKCGKVTGIEEEFIDVADISNVVNSFVQPEIKNLKVETYLHRKTRPKYIALIFVPKSNLLPHVTMRDGGKISKDMLYVRHSGQSEPASYHDYQRVIRECLVLRQNEVLEQLGKSGMYSAMQEMKALLQEIHSAVTEGKITPKAKVEDLFIKDSDFTDLIRQRRQTK